MCLMPRGGRGLANRGCRGGTLNPKMRSSGCPLHYVQFWRSLFIALSPVGCGCAQVGWKMKADAGKKKVVLELGGNAACVVEDFRSHEELQGIIPKLIHGAYYQSGQSCISVQRLFVRQVTI